MLQVQYTTGLVVVVLMKGGQYLSRGQRQYGLIGIAVENLGLWSPVCTTVLQD
jgi:hypothetical protein